MWRDGAVKGGRSSPQYHVELNSPTERQSKGRHPTILPQIPPSTLQQNITLGIAKDRSESWKITNILPENWFREMFFLNFKWCQTGYIPSQRIQQPQFDYDLTHLQPIWVLLLFHNSSAMCFLGTALKQCEQCFDILKLWKETDMCRDGWDFVWIIDTPGPSWHQKRSIKTPPRLNRTPPPPPLPTRGGPRLGLWDAAEAGRRTSKAPKMPKKSSKRLASTSDGHNRCNLASMRWRKIRIHIMKSTKKLNLMQKW